MQRKFSIFIALMLGVSTPALSLDFKSAGASSTEASDISPNVATIADIVSEKPNEAFLDLDDLISYDTKTSSSLSDNDDDYFNDNIVTADESFDTSNYDANEANNTNDNEPIVIKAVKVASPKPTKKSVAKQVAKSTPAKPKATITPATKSVKKSTTKEGAITKHTPSSNDKFAAIPVAEGEEVLVSSSIPGISRDRYIYAQPLQQNAKASGPIFPIVSAIQPQNANNTIVAKAESKKETVKAKSAPQVIDETIVSVSKPEQNIANLSLANTPTPTVVSNDVAATTTNTAGSTNTIATTQAKELTQPTLAQLDSNDMAKFAKEMQIAKVSTIDNDTPFGVTVSKTKPKSKAKKTRSVDIAKLNQETTKSAKTTGKSNPFIRAFSALRPEKMTSAKIRQATSNMAKNAPKRRERMVSSISSESLKRDLNRTYLSDNQYLSPVESIDDEDGSGNEGEEDFNDEGDSDYEDDEGDSDDENIEDEMEESVDEAEEENAEEQAEEMADDINFSYQQNVGAALEGVGPANINAISIQSTANTNSIKSKLNDVKNSKARPSGPLKAGSREVLQMKIDFQENSSAVSGESVNLIRSFAQVATDQPTDSIEITIPQSVMNNPKKKKLTARRLSIVSNILRNAGISDRQIKPVLTDRDENSFAFRIVSNDKFNRLRISKDTNIFGEDENVKEYNIMKW